ncbi:MAG: universal stress protein [Candidatus Marinimicrobia bacterium]|jgi:nucleotide-binding universal stress UspA family protein|nr:universal stress protein [Candidatus Neomarinimicrobiota bacterium]MBT3676898.1 universal stress protein [Candidatus Neomarinimicrobiota bacterium]MBT3764100.1 universal stress protein [Candidatus Neomarinimicrobiota bacterium]MBT4808802.1 universal stress protein [Candidatus Neomarinimicrobiota bacterium]MBT6128881.1 universal stress protein [Candidatus Neomarinimicrobiota bacterium]
MKRIVLTTDFSASARVAYEKAIMLSEGFDMKIDLIHVLNPNIVPPVYYQQLSLPNELERNRNELSDKLELEVLEYLSNCVAEYHLLEGIPFKEIINYSRENQAEMIVMSSHGHSAMNQLLFGSTVDKVVRKSPIPVLSVRDKSISFELP